MLRALVENPVRVEGFDFQRKAIVFKGIGRVDQREGVGMNPAPTAVAADDFRPVHHMVEMAVRQQKQVDFFIRKMRGGSLGRVNEDIALRQFQQIAVGFENSSSKRFELQHKITVQVVHSLEIG